MLVFTLMATLIRHMEASEIIRRSVAQVAALRKATADNPQLLLATKAIKIFQSRRFAGTYSDLLSSDVFSGAARFFLEELYSDRDFSSRDAQFARIAPAIETFFPKQVVSTAVALAELHALTEDLDHEMASNWAKLSPHGYNDSERYVRCWQIVGRSNDRAKQLSEVLQVGAELERLTKKPGLRTLLRMMRRPAEVAGLGNLQLFLESGFDTFADFSSKKSHANEFLATINDRESNWLQMLFSGETEASTNALTRCIMQTDK
jgi:hypothetical protein